MATFCVRCREEIGELVLESWTRHSDQSDKCSFCDDVTGGKNTLIFDVVDNHGDGFSSVTLTFDLCPNCVSVFATFLDQV